VASGIRPTDEFRAGGQFYAQTPMLKERGTVTSQTRTDSRRWAALYVLCAGMLMIVLDVTIVNVALPSIQEDLGFSQSNLAWVVNAYLIAFGGLLLLAGRLGDLIGPRRVFLRGLVIFTAASLACALAQTQGMLIGARFVQGVGGALTSAVILGMIVTMFPEPREQAKALGVYGFVASGGASIGLVAGGVLTDAISWHWIFFVNLPVGIAVALLAQRLVEDRAGIGVRAGADVPGAVLLTGGLMLGVFAILQVSEHGWGATRTLVPGAVAVAMLAAFLARQTRVANPLMPLRLFRSRNASGANVVMALLVVGMFGVFFLGALYLQQILGYDALEVGFAFLPSTVVMGALSLGVAGRLAMRFGPKPVLVASLPLIAAGLALFSRAPVAGSYVEHVLPVTLLLGIGAGLATPALMMLAMSGATPEDAGMASGLVNTTTQVGGAIGLAVLATLAAGRTSGQIREGVANAAALNSGFHLAYLVAAAAVVLSVLVAIVVLHTPQPAGDVHAVEGEAPEPALALPHAA
jgi:EmrB/QacA subfamily drug resistance transporter